MFLLARIITLSIGLFVFLLFIRSKEKKLPFRLFGLHYAILIFLSFNGIIAESGLIFDYPHLINTCAPLGYLIGPLTYLFIRTLLNNQSRLSKKDYWHFLPFLLHFTELLPFYFSHGTYKVILWTNSVIKHSGNDWIEISAHPNYTILHNLLKFISGNLYLLFAIKLYFDFRKTAPKYTLIENKGLIRFSAQFILVKAITHVTVFIGIFFAIYNINLERIIFDLNLLVMVVLNIYLFILNPHLLFGMQYTQARLSKKAIKEIEDKDIVISGFHSGSFEATIFIDKNYKILHFNKAANDFTEHLLGFPLIQGDDVRKYLSANLESLFLNGIAEAFNGQTNEFEYLIKYKGNHIWRLFNFQPIVGDENSIKGAIFTTKDISEKKLSEIKISNYKKELDEIAWRESHLIRSPVANILGISSLLLKPESTIELNEKLSLLKHVHSEVERLDDVIFQIVKKTDELKKDDDQNAEKKY